MTEYDTDQKPQSYTFLDRKEELKQIHCSCYAPESRLVIGGAQMGKTAILRELESSLWKKFREGRRSKKDLRLIPIYFNIGPSTARQDSVNILFGKILREATKTVSRRLQLPNVREKLDKFLPRVDNPEVFRPDGKGAIELFDGDLEVFRGRVEKALNCNIRLVFLLDDAQNLSLTKNARSGFAQFLEDLVVDTDLIDTESYTESLRSSVFIITCNDEVDKLFPDPYQILQDMPATKLYAFSGDRGRCEFVIPLLKSRFGEGAQGNTEWMDKIAEAICRWAGGHPKLLAHFVEKVSPEDRDIDVSWIRRHHLSEHVRTLLDSCIQAYDLRRQILTILAKLESPVTETTICENASADPIEVWGHLEALKYHGLVQELDEGYILAGKIFRIWVHRINRSLQVPAQVLYTTLPTGVLHLYDQESLPLVEFTITNNTDKPQSVILTSWIEGYSFRRTDQVDIEPGEQKIFAQLPQLDHEKIKHITEICSAVLHTKVEYLLDGERKQLRAQDYDVEFLARNVIRWAIPSVGGKPGKYQSLAHHIGAWVTPRVESVQEVLRHAVDLHPDEAIVGYQGSPNPETARKQVKAIFQVLKKKVKLAYVNSPFAFGAQPGEVQQTVRLPRESLETRSANCIDGTVLYASLMKLADLNPVIVLQTGHAFVGWETWPGSGEYEFVETTMTLKEPFEKAFTRGMEEYQDLLNKGWFDRPLFDPKGFALLLPLDDLYQRRIKPMEGAP